MKPLGYNDLTYQERLDLSRMTEHPGFLVQKKLFDDACRQAVEAVIKLNPEDADYDRLLRTRQSTARTVNEVCATLLKSVAMHATSARVEESAKKLDEENQEVSTPLNSRFGSATIKSRKEVLQSNQ